MHGEIGIKEIAPQNKKEFAQRIVGLYHDGFSTTQIAKSFNVSPSIVWNNLRKQGIQLRTFSEATNLFIKQGRGNSKKRHLLLKLSLVQALYKEGKSVPEIASLIGVSSPTLYRFLKTQGFKLRSSSEAARVLVARGLNPIRGSQKGNQSPSWKGGKFQDQEGYIKVYNPNHPRASPRYVLEHILVWEQYHKKLLPVGYVIHHLNGIKNDNRPHNLIALPVGKHHNQLVNQELKKRVRELEIENRQLTRVLEDSQMILYINEN